MLRQRSVIGSIMTCVGCGQIVFVGDFATVECPECKGNDMDPTACFKRMMDAYKARDWEEVQAASEDLSGWMERGGFAPEQMAGAGDNAKLLTVMVCSRMADVTA